MRYITQKHLPWKAGRFLSDQVCYGRQAKYYPKWFALSNLLWHYYFRRPVSVLPTTRYICLLRSAAFCPTISALEGKRFTNQKICPRRQAASFDLLARCLAAALPHTCCLRFNKASLEREQRFRRNFLAHDTRTMTNTVYHGRL